MLAIHGARRLTLASLLAAALLVALPAPAARAERLFLPLDREGPWLGSDKTLHFAGSLAIAASFRLEGRDEGSAVGVTIGLGVAKEIFDAAFKSTRHGRGASRKDLVVDLLGATAGILFIRAIDR